MTFHGLYFLGAIVLLGWPTPLWVGHNFHRPGHDHSPSVPDLLRAWQNWADLLRAAGGTYLLREMALSASPDVPGAETTMLLVQGLVLTVGLAVQMAVRRKEWFLLAPVFYLNGVVVSNGDFVVGGFALLVGWMFAVAGKNPPYQLPAMTVALLVGGYFLSGISIWLMCNIGLMLLPLVVVLLASKQLSFVAPMRR